MYALHVLKASASLYLLMRQNFEIGNVCITCTQGLGFTVSPDEKEL